MQHYKSLLFFLLAALPCLLTAQVDYYLKIDDIPGESSQAGFERQICITSFSWGAEREEDTGRRLGAAVNGPFKISKAIDAASTELFFAMASGTVIPDAELSITAFNPDDGEVETKMKITFTNVLISSYQTGGSSGEGPVRDVVTFIAEEVEVSYFRDGSLFATRAWDFGENTGG